MCDAHGSGYTLLVSHHGGVVMDACCCIGLHDVCMGMVVLDDAAGCCLPGHGVGCYLHGAVRPSV